MISCLKQKRSGKTTILLNEARKEKDSIVIGFGHKSRGFLFYKAMEIFKEEIESSSEHYKIIKFKDGNRMYFNILDDFTSRRRRSGLSSKERLTPKFVDELPILLDNLLGGNVKMFTGTTEQYEPNEFLRNYFAEPKQFSNKEEFENEVLGKFSLDEEKK